MNLRLIFTAFALSFLPFMAHAQCSQGESMSTSHCADGEMWDVSAQACVPMTNA